MFTMTKAQRAGHLYVYATADIVTEESAAHGDAARRGWIDAADPFDVHDSRNDVPPVWDAPVADLIDGRDHGNGLTETPDEVRADLFDALQSFGPLDGPAERGTLYVADDVVDYATGERAHIAFHVFVKYVGADGSHVETPLTVAIP